MSERDPSVPPWWQIALAIEGVAAVIALATTITPSKTGSDWSFAELFFEAPTFLQEVAVDLVFVNLLLLAIGVPAYWYVRRSGAGEG